MFSTSVDSVAKVDEQREREGVEGIVEKNCLLTSVDVDKYCFVIPLQIHPHPYAKST